MPFLPLRLKFQSSWLLSMLFVETINRFAFHIACLHTMQYVSGLLKCAWPMDDAAWPSLSYEFNPWSILFKSDHLVERGVFSLSCLYSSIWGL